MAGAAIVEKVMVRLKRNLSLNVLVPILILGFGNLWIQGAWAIPIVITDPSPMYSAQVEGCPTHEWCASNAFLDTTTVKFGDDKFNTIFKTAFDAWNAIQPAGKSWTLADGGTTLAAGFGINTYRAQILNDPLLGYRGGVEINVDFLYAGSDRTDYLWAQGIYANYKPSGRVAPYFFMDTTDLSTCVWASCWAPPLYPYQYPPYEDFYDFPKDGFPDAFFEADAFLTKVDSTNRVLTVYEGIHYGFALSVPEPNVLALFAIGWASLLMISSMRKRGKVPIENRGSGNMLFKFLVTTGLL